jgi:hypothetical protein
VRFRRKPVELPDDVDTLLRHHMAEWSFLDDTERRRVLGDTAHYLASFRFEAAQGFTLTPEITTVVSAQAALMALGFDHDPFTNVKAVVVHQRSLVKRGPRQGPVPGVMTDDPSHLDGEAHDRHGPVLLSWRAARNDLRHHGNGFNVVIHELAHKLDMRDGLIDGVPGLLPAELRGRWRQVSATEYAAVRRGDPHLLRSYAGTDMAEFFAVASEAFFDMPMRLSNELPALYELLVAVYRQRPTERRASANEADPAVG